MSQRQMQAGDRLSVRNTAKWLVCLIAQLEEPTLGPVEREELADQIAGFCQAALIWMRRVPGLRIGRECDQLVTDVKVAIQLVGPLPSDRGIGLDAWMSAVIRMVFAFWMPVPDGPIELRPDVAT